MSALNLTRVYRAHVQPADWPSAERTAFIEASSHHAAVRKIAVVVAALEYRSPDPVEERIYNCKGAEECIEEGLSADLELRLFEIGWNGHEPIAFVEHPLFLLDECVALIRKWAAITPKADP